MFQDPEGTRLRDLAFMAIRPKIFLIETQHQFATGFLIARLPKTRRLILATAAHLVDNVTKEPEINWLVRQFDESGGIIRRISFRTPSETPYFLKNNKWDVGILFIPDDGKFYSDSDSPVTTIHVDKGAATSTPVAWAGYPGHVWRYLHATELCYFEGVISANINRLDKRSLYVVDGHALKGVSGGPVWRWSDKGAPEVVAIVSNYQLERIDDEAGEPVTMPGFCVFEPVNAVVGFLTTDVFDSQKIGEQVEFNQNPR